MATLLDLTDVRSQIDFKKELLAHIIHFLATFDTLGFFNITFHP